MLQKEGVVVRVIIVSKLINICNMYFASIQVSLCVIIINMFFCQIGKDKIKLAIRVDLCDKL